MCKVPVTLTAGIM